MMAENQIQTAGGPGKPFQERAHHPLRRLAAAFLIGAQLFVGACQMSVAPPDENNRHTTAMLNAGETGSASGVNIRFLGLSEAPVWKMSGLCMTFDYPVRYTLTAGAFARTDTAFAGWAREYEYSDSTHRSYRVSVMADSIATTLAGGVQARFVITPN